MPQRYQVHRNQVYAWKKQLQEHVAQAFDPKLGQDAEARTLHAKIDEPTIENDFFAKRIRTMGAPDRRVKLDRDHPDLSVRRQCAMLGIARWGVYRQPSPANDNGLALMRRIEFMCWPFFCSRRIAAMLQSAGTPINHKRVQRLMRQMGIAALGPKPWTSKPAPGHTISPYLLRDIAVERGWAADITYIPPGRGFLYLVAVMDWWSRRWKRRWRGSAGPRS